MVEFTAGWPTIQGHSGCALAAEFGSAMATKTDSARKVHRWVARLIHCIDGDGDTKGNGGIDCDIDAFPRWIGCRVCRTSPVIFAVYAKPINLESFDLIPATTPALLRSE
jgi:hypothetical protein